MRGYSFSELVKMSEGALKRNGDTATGNLTAPKFLLSAPQAAEPNSVVRKDFFDSTVAGLNAENSTMKLNIWEAMRRSYAEAGYNLVAGSFEAGGTLVNTNDVLLHEASGEAFSGPAGNVSAGTNPTLPSSGYVSRTDVLLRNELAAAGGAGLVDGVAKPVTWVGFAGGADPTGVRDSTAAFQAANATKSKVKVPKGRYKLTADVVSDPLTSWDLEMDVLFIGGYWLRQVPWMAGLGNNIYYYLERHCRNVGIAPTDGVGIFGSAHSGGGGAGGAALAVAGMAYNDDTSGIRSSVWALYGSAVRNAGTIGASHGLELDIANRGSEEELYPNSMFPNGQTHALWLGSGGELTQAGEALNSASAAIGIIANDKTAGKTARFLKGIVFGSNSLKGTDGGSTGQGVAIAFGNRHAMTWYNNSNYKTAEILSTLEDETKSTRMLFSDNGVSLTRLSNGLPIFSVEAGPTAPANYLAMRSQAASNPPAVGVAGSDANIDLRLSTKGTGTVRVDSSITPTSPGSTSTVGTAGRVWAGAFFQTAPVITSDERYKSAPEEITDAMLDAAAEVDWCMFQYLDRVDAKGADGARWHFGAMAQRFVEAFERHGLDPYRFAFICYDEWKDQYVKVQTNEGELVTKTRTVSQPVMVTTTREVLVDRVLEDGTKIKKATMEEYQTPKLIQVYIFNEDGSPHLDGNGVRAFVMEPVMEDIIEEYTEPAPPEYVDVLEVPAGSRYGIRYDQVIIIKQKQIERDHKRQIDSLVARIEALEAK